MSIQESVDSQENENVELMEALFCSGISCVRRLEDNPPFASPREVLENK